MKLIGGVSMGFFGFLMKLYFNNYDGKCCISVHRSKTRFQEAILRIAPGLPKKLPQTASKTPPKPPDL
jgi:hypothetical protein